MMAKFSKLPYDKIAPDQMFDGLALRLPSGYRCQFLNPDACQCEAEAKVVYPIHQTARHKGGIQWMLAALCLEHYQFFK